MTDTAHAPTPTALRRLLDAGDITKLSYAREMREHWPATLAYERALTDAHEAGERHTRKLVAEARASYYYTDEWCRRRARSDLEGHAAEGKLLLELDTPAERREAIRLARRYTNATASAGRWSDALRSCLADARGFVPEPTVDPRLDVVADLLVDINWEVFSANEVADAILSALDKMER